MLRNRLQEMTDVNDVSQHPALLMQLTRDVQNSIRILESGYPIDRYTCVMHAFDFTEKPDYTAIASFGSGRIFAGATFIDWLLARNHLIAVPHGNAGDLVLYFSNEQFEHIGIVGDRARIISKWGTGHLYEHEALEVPSRYGDVLRFYSALSYADAYNYFVEFAEENGMQFE
ncbi:hypothetical protein [Desulfoluna butyratoxydans]|uniref:Uncharacterized protein n=1 Tax=Desulfoluna butyratoxydans TaxID=231438 RepID=A0A4U8YWW3_9BACT|nr:hypothetical protein [Desulfoluna butyratoxydans]VFQ45923.1 hypothetical protein MSL71_35860 [Desulfoluna butyratoxydans]